jgi:hypothetical protein
VLIVGLVFLLEEVFSEVRPSCLDQIDRAITPRDSLLEGHAEEVLFVHQANFVLRDHVHYLLAIEECGITHVDDEEVNVCGLEFAVLRMR